MTLTELVIKRPSIVVVIFAVLGVLGLLSLTQLNYELLPKMENPVVTITTVYPGASPNEVENTVSKPIEDAVSGIDKVKTIRTTSQEGFSFVMVEFDQSAKIDVALQDAQRKIGEVVPRFPTEVKTPTLAKFALDELPIVRAGMTSDLPDREFYQLLKDRIKPALSKVPGVGQIVIIGGEEREIRVNIDAQRLRTYGLSLNQVTGSIRGGNLDFPTGKIEDTDGEYIVRVAGKFESVEDLRNLVVGRSKAGGDIRLSDVADVVDGSSDMATMSRINGKSSVVVNVIKQNDANAVDVSRLVRAEFEKLKKEHARIKLAVEIAADGSTFTLDAAKAVQTDLLIAIALVALVMLVFLHSIRNSFIVMIAIPASLISTFIAMYVFDFSLNLMTLLGLSLVVGILVDDSIVVLENIYRHLEMGADRRTAAIKGRNEIGFTALSITLVDVVVFLPLSLTSGLVGNILREFAVVVVVSTLLSLLVSFTITPVLASRISKLQPLTKNSLMGRFGLWFERQYDRLRDTYGNLLKWTIAKWWHAAAVGVMAFVMLMGSFALLGMGFIGFEFITQADRGEFAIAIELPPGTSLDSTNMITRSIEEKVMDMPEVERVLTNVGVANEGLLGQPQSSASELNVTLVGKQQRTRSTDEVGEAIKGIAMSYPGVKARYNPIGIFGTANETPVQVVISGPTDSAVRTTAGLVASILDSIPGATDIRLSSEEGQPETRVELDREKMAALGLTVADVGATLRVALSGDDEAKYRDGKDEYAIRVRLDEFDRSRTDNLESLTFLNRSGQQIELKQFANVVQTTGLTKLQRKDRNSSVTVFAQAIGVPSGTIGQQFEQRLANAKLPDGISFAYDGDLRNQQETGGSMGIAFMVGLLFVYLVMVALYNSYLYPLVVLFSIPLAMIGALLALALSAKSMSFFSILGMVMLMGLVAKNAILLVDFTNRLRAEGLSIREALFEAGKERLRPILMTTLTMIFGMMPIAVSAAAGAEWKSGLAWALIGGLTSSMFLTLIVIPVVYWTFASIQDWLATKKEARAARRGARVAAGGGELDVATANADA